jgi:anhydro-N-acetylmuramic acid kinase
MSGTSLDGLDMACVDLDLGNRSFTWGPVTTLDYSHYWKDRLRTAHSLDMAELENLNHEYASWLGEQCRDFLYKHSLEVDFIASHGHTVHHRPEEGYTYQLGNHPMMARVSGHKVVCDFRTQDVKLGGQGAPLVPIGDALLFSDFTFCLNLGGFANVSFDQSGTRIAFDIGPCNIVLNHMSAMIGRPFDKEGEIARSGRIIPDILEKWNDLEFYLAKPPKSLGREWVEENILPVMNKDPDHNIPDLLRTSLEHTAIQIGKILEGKGTCLVTGGGVKNTFLMERIMALSKADIHVPDITLIDYKEALIFGLLGALKVEGKNNILASVTGAPYDHSGGIIFEP